MKNSARTALALFIATWFAVHPAAAQFKPALPGYRYQFPRDYFSHPDFQTEWWYYTGNLHAADGRKFGFELTFFRSGVSRSAGGRSPWSVGDLYFAHFAVSDLDGGRFLHTERSNRAGPGIAGADEAQKKVWNGNWSVRWSGGAETLAADAGQFAIQLSLRPQKPPVIHGQNGVSQKSAGAGRASHYFSETHLQTEGELRIGQATYAVAGLAWMDHEFFTQQLEENQAGWDWLSLQFADNTELMLFRIRRKDGSHDPFSAGTFVDAQGRARHIAGSEFSFAPNDRIWTSPVTHAAYPIRWRISLPALNLEGEISTPLARQEMTSGARFVPSYWEGAVVFIGPKGSARQTGSGYLEMTGYDRPVAMGSALK